MKSWIGFLVVGMFTVKGMAMIPPIGKVSAGMAEIKITPPAGAPLVTRPSTGVHDDLWARALVVDNGSQRAAIVCLDLTGMGYDMTDELRERIQKRTGIKRTLVNFTHTHSSPFSMPYSVTNWHWFMGEGRSWREALLTNVTEVVVQANANLSPSSVRIGRAAVTIGRNRRLDLLPSNQQTQLTDAETIVPWTDVLRVDGVDGIPRAILFSYAAHPVVVHHASDLISADYAGYAVRTVRDHYGNAVVALFAQGCGGDINGEPLNSGFEAAEAAGKRLGEAVIKACDESEYLNFSDLKIQSRTFSIPLSDSPGLPECRQRLAQVQARMCAPQVTQLSPEEVFWGHDEILCLQDIIKKLESGMKSTLRFEAHALAVGDQWCLLTLPHEMFSAYQRWVEKISPFKRTMVLGYTNACESYIPTDEDFGGAEIAPFGAPLWYHLRFAPQKGLEGLIKEQVLSLLSQTVSNGSK